MSNDSLQNMYKLNFNTSLAHIIGNVTMLVTEHYKEQFPKNFFKSSYVNTTMNSRIFIEKRKDIVNLKQRKPILAVNPIVNADAPEFATTSYFNNIFGKDIYPGRAGNPMVSTLFYNKDTSSIIEFSINRLSMTFEISQTYETIIQQLNALGVMKSSMRLDHPYTFTSLVEVPLPNSLVLELIDKLGLSDKNIIDVTKELNKYSQYPITYKLETSTGKYRYFFELNTSIQIKFENPSKNDGEEKGQTKDNYEITQSLSVEFNYVDTFYYINNKEISSSLVESSTEDLMGKVTIVPVLSTDTGLVIPELNSNGKVFYTATELLIDEINTDTKVDVTNISGLLTVYDFQVLDDISKNQGLDREKVFDKYYELEYYNKAEKLQVENDYIFDSKTMDLTTLEPDIFSQYAILIYRDNIGLNAALHELNKYTDK